jgi:hypothetical protein
VRQKNAQSGALRLSREFSRNRAYFAAVETQVSQHAVIELAKRVAERACLAALSIARVRFACECADCPHHLGKDLGESERALDPCRTMQFVRARRSGRCGRAGLGIAAEAVYSTRMARPRFDVFLVDRGLLTGRVAAGMPVPRDVERSIAVRPDAVWLKIINCNQPIQFGQIAHRSSFS